ncbi:hypothetical protein BBJ28_00018952 [Nothophytophthora sp. Chile5]|nr:hypothetical protein BBJ28_00018952 [Nothophytophthora sp. Chile5]
MATCPQCYTGTCSRHKRQDHGRSTVKSVNAESTMQKIYDKLVGAKLQKLQAEAEKDPSRQHTAAFRQQLDASRDKSMRKSSKSRAKRANVSVTGSGLNPQALAAIYGDDSSDSDRESRRKKRKKDKKRKHKLASESSSSHKSKEGSDRKRKHRRSRSDSDSGTDEDSSSESSGEGSGDDAATSRHKHKKSSSSRKHSHHKKSSKKKKAKRRRTDSE